MPRALRSFGLSVTWILATGASSMGQYEVPAAPLPPVGSPPGTYATADGMASLDAGLPFAGPDGEILLEPGTRIPASGTFCTCGERRGLSRWRWHRTQCKRHLQEHFLGYPEEFQETPLGASLVQTMRTQVGNAQAVGLTFYDYDFVGGTSQLNLRGRDKLAMIAAKLPATFCPVVIERTPAEPGLDQARRLIVLNELSRGSFPVAAERVIVGKPLAGGLNGIEAEIIYGAQLNQLQAGSAVAGGGSTAAQSFDSSGLSGSAVAPVP